MKRKFKECEGEAETGAAPLESPCQGSQAPSPTASDRSADNHPTCSFEIAGESYNVHVTNELKSDDIVATWFSKLYEAVETEAKRVSSNSEILAVVGLDCEWAPPWFRDNKPEKVNTIQLYNPFGHCLVLSVGEWDILPPPLVAMLADKRIAKVGVNITGDGARLARDFNCSVHGLLNLEKGHGPRMTMEKLCKIHCPKEFHIDKDSVENQVRLGNWASWPLSDLQLKYASIDAVISFAIFLFQHENSWNAKCSMEYSKIGNLNLDSCEPAANGQKTVLQRAPSTGGKHSNFFLMHQNRSIVPPNMNKKHHPIGSKTALNGKVIVISGVLDSMSREEMTTYVLSHGGKVGKSVTKATTHLVNDHGTVGPSKLSKCEAQGIPIVNEDFIISMVKASTGE